MESKRQSSELSADIMLVSKAKDLFKEDIKSFNKTIKLPIHSHHQKIRVTATQADGIHTFFNTLACLG
jgi:hypothetical protein